MALNSPETLIDTTTCNPMKAATSTSGCLTMMRIFGPGSSSAFLFLFFTFGKVLSQAEQLMLSLLNYRPDLLRNFTIAIIHPTVFPSTILRKAPDTSQGDHHSSYIHILFPDKDSACLVFPPSLEITMPFKQKRNGYTQPSSL